LIACRASSPRLFGIQRSSHPESSSKPLSSAPPRLAHFTIRLISWCYTSEAKSRTRSTGISALSREIRLAGQVRLRIKHPTRRRRSTLALKSRISIFARNDQEQFPQSGIVVATGRHSPSPARGRPSRGATGRKTSCASILSRKGKHCQFGDSEVGPAHDIERMQALRAACDHQLIARFLRCTALRSKNSAWLTSAETVDCWYGLETRNAGSGRSPVRKRSG
jgi:hypothetical protein